MKIDSRLLKVIKEANNEISSSILDNAVKESSKENPPFYFTASIDDLSPGNLVPGPREEIKYIEYEKGYNPPEKDYD